MQILADSGILLRLFEPTDSRHVAVQAAADTFVAQGHELVAAAQNLAEFWNVCTRPATARGGFGLRVCLISLGTLFGGSGRAAPVPPARGG